MRDVLRDALTPTKGDDQQLARDGDASVSSAVLVGSGRILCEAVLWCEWHRGDLFAHSFGTTLELEVPTFFALVDRYPTIKEIGIDHSEIFCDLVNHRPRSDLFDS